MGNKKGKDERWWRKALILTSGFCIHVHTRITSENLPGSLHHGVAMASLLVEVDNTTAASVSGRCVAGLPTDIQVRPSCLPPSTGGILCE